VAEKFHFAVLRIEITHASRGLCAIAELLVLYKGMKQMLGPFKFCAFLWRTQC